MYKLKVKTNLHQNTANKSLDKASDALEPFEYGAEGDWLVSCHPGVSSRRFVSLSTCCAAYSAHPLGLPFGARSKSSKRSRRFQFRTCSGSSSPLSSEESKAPYFLQAQLIWRWGGIWLVAPAPSGSPLTRSIRPTIAPVIESRSVYSSPWF